MDDTPDDGGVDTATKAPKSAEKRHKAKRKSSAAETTVVAATPPIKVLSTKVRHDVLPPALLPLPHFLPAVLLLNYSYLHYCTTALLHLLLADMLLLSCCTTLASPLASLLVCCGTP